MNVSDIMSREVRTCSPNDSLNTAAQLMWENDYGCVPVVDAEGKITAMVTDRDICMAAYTQGKALANLLVSAAASQNVVTLRERDTIDVAEALMQKHRIRRLPVLDAAGKLVGILSMNDLARHAQESGHRRSGLTAEGIARTLAAVCEPTRLRAQAAE